MAETIGDVHTDKIKRMATAYAIYVAKYNDIAATVNKYYPDVAKAFKSAAATCDSAIKALSIDKSMLMAAPTVEGFNKIKIVYDQFQVILDSLDAMRLIVTNKKYQNEAFLNMSDSFKESYIRALSEANKIYRNIVTAANTKEYEMIYAMFDRATHVDTSSNATLLEIANICAETSKVNDLVLYFLSRIVARSAHLPRDIAERLKNAVTRHQDRIMNARRIVWQKSDVHVTYPPRLMVRCGLVPITPYMPFVDLYAAMRAFDELPPMNAFDQLATHFAKTYVVVVVEISDKDPLLEYNILPLIDDNYIAANEMGTDKNSGLNARIQRRFDTIKQIGAPQKENKTRVKVLGGSRDSDRAAIVFYAAGDNYRIMGRRLGVIGMATPALQHADRPKYKTNGGADSNIALITVPLNTIGDLINGVNTRIANHNAIIADQVFQRAPIEKFGTFAARFEEEASAPSKSLEVAFDIIIKELKLRFEKGDDSTPRTNYDLYMMLAPVDDITAVLTSVTKTHISRDMSMQPASGMEAIVSLAVKCDKLISRFLRTYRPMLQEAMQAQKITVQRVAEVNDARAFLCGFYIDVVERVLDEINAPPSIFDEIGYSAKEFYENWRLLN
jgi:hypothetical protein